MGQILFLTACVNPKGMAYTKLSNPEIRLQQYKDALDWYLENTTMKILLVENSGYDFSDCYQKQIREGRLEFLCYNGNDYDRNRGKGYGEAEIMEYGLLHSKFINNNPNILIVKVTGRLFCRNIKELCKRYHQQQTVYANIAKDDWNGNIIVSQFFIAPADFLLNCFLSKREEINDSNYRHFEHVLYDSITDWEQKKGRFREFWNPLILEGISGTSGAIIKTTLSLKQLLQYRLMYLLHKIGYRGYINPFYHGQPKQPIKV